MPVDSPLIENNGGSGGFFRFNNGHIATSRCPTRHTLIDQLSTLRHSLDPTLNRTKASDEVFANLIPADWILPTDAFLDIGFKESACVPWVYVTDTASTLVSLGSAKHPSGDDVQDLDQLFAGEGSLPTTHRSRRSSSEDAGGPTMVAVHDVVIAGNDGS